MRRRLELTQGGEEKARVAGCKETHTHKFKKRQPDDNTKAKGEMYVRSLHFNLVLLFFVAILEL